MFAISTSHAANLQRHRQGWMTWSEYRLNIALLGFIDLHTDIDKYYVSVGRDFMTDNLNKVLTNSQSTFKKVQQVSWLFSFLQNCLHHYTYLSFSSKYRHLLIHS